MANDEELALELAAGEDSALAELLRRYDRSLAHFIHRHTGGRDVEDIFQETWLRVVRNARTFDATRKFSTWLFQIALNLCRDWHRRPPPEAHDGGEARAGGAGFDRVDAGIDAARLLEQLPLEQREVVILRYYHDLRESDVAAILDLPKGTVKSRMHNALKKLAALARGTS